MMRHYVKLMMMLTLISTTIRISQAERVFHSRDAEVRNVIAGCLHDVENIPAQTVNSHCRLMLQCILNDVDASRLGRWSAGASILAFVPTIAALMSNSIDDIMLVSEESWVLASFLAVGSITAFTARFADFQDSTRDIASIKEDISRRVKQACKADRAFHRRREYLCLAFLAAFSLVLWGACFAVWYPAYLIWRNGVVVFSCPFRLHAIIWIALVQATTLISMLLHPCTIDKAEVSLKPRFLPGASFSRPSRIAFSPWPEKLLLRAHKHTTLATLIRGVVSGLSTALYAYATAMLSGMTMYPASDAVRALVAFSVSAGMARIIASIILEGPYQRQRLIMAVPVRHLEALQEYAEDVAQTQWPVPIVLPAL